MYLIYYTVNRLRSYLLQSKYRAENRFDVLHRFAVSVCVVADRCSPRPASRKKDSAVCCGIDDPAVFFHERAVPGGHEVRQFSERSLRIVKAVMCVLVFNEHCVFARLPQTINVSLAWSYESPVIRHTVKNPNWCAILKTFTESSDPLSPTHSGVSSGRFALRF